MILLLDFDVLMLESSRKTGLKMDSRTLLRIVKISACPLLVVLSLFIFSSSMGKPVVDAEHASCAAGVLLTKGKIIYRDFACVAQMPYHPFLCAAIYKVLNTTYYLFTARLLTVVCDILIVLSIIGIFRHIFIEFPVTGWLLSMAMTILCVFNKHFDDVIGFALNQDFMILCVLLSFWLFISTDFQRSSQYLRIGVISALLTLASCLDFSTAFILLPFFVMLLFLRTRSGKERFKAVFAFLITPIIVLILPIWTIIQSPHAFLINVFELPILRMRFIRRTKMLMGETLLGKLAEITVHVTEPRGIFPFLVAICLIVLIVWNRKKLRVSNPINALLAVLIPVTFFGIILCSPDVMYEHLARLIPFIIISFAYPLLYLSRLGTGNTHKFFRIAAIVIAACTFSQAVSQPILQRTLRIFRPENWVPMKVHQISEEVAQRTKEPKLIVTFLPLFALESGCEIYPELSSGWDGCKIANALPSFKREITRTLNTKAFKEMLEERPPSAVIVDRKPTFPVGLAILRIAKTRWPEQEYDENIWERIKYDFDVVVYYYKL